MKKERKRWLGLLLTLLLCLPLTPAARPIVQAAEPAEMPHAAAVLSGLGITDSIQKESADATVSREEMAVVLAGLSGGELPVPAPVISDIENSQYKAAIQTVVDAQMMLLYQDGTFRPQENVTWPMALESMLRLTGQDRVVSQEGDAFFNNRKQANLLGMLAGLSPELREITWGELCGLVFNAFEVPVLYAYDNGQEHYIGNTGQTVMQFFLGLEQITGIVQSVGMYSLSGNTPLGWDTAVIDGTVYKIASFPEWKDKLGYRVDAYFNRSGETKTLVYAELAGDKQLRYDINVRDIMAFDEEQRQITYYPEDEKREKYMTIPADADVLLNGSLITQPLKAVIEETFSGQIQGIDNDGDGLAEVFLVSRRDVFVVDSVNTNEESVYIKLWPEDSGQQSGVEKISLKDQDQISILDMQGYVRTLGELKAWDVIVMERNETLKSVSVICPFESVMGLAETVSGDGEEQKITIEGKTYEMSRSYFTQYGQKEALAAGINYTLKLDMDGRIAAVVKSAVGKGRIGYLINSAPSQSAFGGGDAQLKILTEDGQIQILTLGKAKVDQISYQDGDAAVQALNQAFETLNAEAKASIAKLIIYEADSQQKVVSIDTPYQSVKEDNQSFRAVPLFGTYGFVNKLRRSDTIEGNYRIDASAKVFVIPPGDEKTVQNAEAYNFMVKNALSHLGDGISHTIQAFKYTEGSYTLDVLVAQQGGEGAINADMPVHLVKSCFKSLDETGNETAGMEVITADVYGGRNENSYTAVDPELFADVHAGDVVQLVLNDKGQVTYLRPVLYVDDPDTGQHLSLKKPAEPDDGQWDNYAEPSKVLLAGAYCRENNSLVVNRGPKVLKSSVTPAKDMSVLAAEEADPTRLSGFMGSTYIYPLDTMTNVFIFDTKKDQFLEATGNDIVDYKSDPENYSQMMLFTWWGGIRCVVIYQ